MENKMNEVENGWTSSELWSKDETVAIYVHMHCGIRNEVEWVVVMYYVSEKIVSICRIIINAVAVAGNIIWFIKFIKSRHKNNGLTRIDILIISAQSFVQSLRFLQQPPSSRTSTKSPASAS